MKEEKAFGWENWKPKYRRLEAEYIVAGSDLQDREACPQAPSRFRTIETWWSQSRRNLTILYRRTTVGGVG